MSPLSSVGRIWRIFLSAIFFLLCLRFVFAGLGIETLGGAGPHLALLTGGFLLAGLWPQAAMFAFLALLPWLSGLSGLGLLLTVSPSSLVFCSMVLGWNTREVIGWATRKREATPGHDEGGLLNRARFAAEVLISIVFISLAVQIGRSPDLTGLGQRALTQAGFGFGDPAYFLTSSFLWLQGLYCFCRLARETLGVARWITPLMVIHAVTLGLFFVAQLRLDIPEPYQGYAYYLPFEDISSFGSLVLAVFMYLLVTWPASPGKIVIPHALLRGLGLICLFVVLVASWSRGAWLAAGLLLLVAAWLRLSRKWLLILATAAFSVVAMINFNATNEAWLRNPYLVRLITLVRVEHLANKSTGRLELWHKAAGMIRERPITGHGIGSFYLKSPRYALPHDPYGPLPDFAHNSFLQFAAELGLPAILVFGGGIGWALWQGLRLWIRRSGSPKATPGQDLPMLGVTLALGAYLLTQMTANSLNVYVSNQFFFFFLLATLLTLVQSRRQTITPPGAGHSAIPRDSATM